MTVVRSGLSRWSKTNSIPSCSGTRLGVFTLWCFCQIPLCLLKAKPLWVQNCSNTWISLISYMLSRQIGDIMTNRFAATDSTMMCLSLVLTQSWKMKQSTVRSVLISLKNLKWTCHRPPPSLLPQAIQFHNFKTVAMPLHKPCGMRQNQSCQCMIFQEDIVICSWPRCHATRAHASTNTAALFVMQSIQSPSVTDPATVPTTTALSLQVLLDIIIFEVVVWRLWIEIDIKMTSALLVPGFLASIKFLNFCQTADHTSMTQS